MNQREQEKEEVDEITAVFPKQGFTVVAPTFVSVPKMRAVFLVWSLPARINGSNGNPQVTGKNSVNNTPSGV